MLKHCGLKLFTSGKLTKLGCPGIRVESVGAVVPWSMGVWKHWVSGNPVLFRLLHAVGAVRLSRFSLNSARVAASRLKG
jgi:hypothetical protein